MQTFLSLLSPSLRSAILYHIYRDIIKSINIFKTCHNVEKHFIVNHMKTVIFLPGDVIIRQGDKGNKIYFISRGRVDIFIGPDDKEDEIEEGAFELKRLNSNGSKRSHKSSSLKSFKLERSKPAFLMNTIIIETEE